jgi:tetratricopeptide (TPR) repeat protein
MRRLLAGLIARPRRSVILIGLLVLGGFLAVQGYALYQLRAGRAALDQGRTAAARRHLAACLRVWPNSTAAHLLAARAARRAGAYDEAAHHLAVCQKVDGKKDDDVVLEWSLQTAAKGDLLEVEETLRARARKDPALAPLVWEALAEGNMRMYRNLTALEILDEWVKVEPDNPRVRQLRGNLFRQLSGNKAVPEYTRAVELDPENDEARWWLAVVLQEVGRFDDALKHLEQLRARGWPDGDLRPRIARSLDRVGRTQDARELLDAVLAEDPKHSLALRVRGQIEFLAEPPNLPEAEKWLREAARALPYDYQVRSMLAQCLRQENKTDEAREEEEQARKLMDRSERLGDLRGQKMSQTPHDPALHCEIGVLLDSLGHADLAEKWLYSALHEDADYRPAHAALADFYERHRKPDKAAEHRELARGATAPDPDVPRAKAEKKPEK